MLAESALDLFAARSAVYSVARLVASDEPADVDEHQVRVAPSPRMRLLDSLTLLALLAAVASAALSFLFAMLFESGPLLGFCVFSLFIAGVAVVARTLLAMGYDRSSGS